MLRKKLMKKSIALLLAAGMVTCAGCGQQTVEKQDIESVQSTVSDVSSTESQDNATKVEEERVTLTIAAVASDRVVDYETNYLTGLLEETANVDLEFVILPATETKQKITMMMSSGEKLPDIFIGSVLGSADLLAYGEAGKILPLTEYFNDPEAMPLFHENVTEEDKALMINYVMSANGELYSGPTYSPELGNEYPDRAYINTDWLEALNLEMPTTTEQFYDVLKAFKEQDPNGNGIADEIPMVGSKGGWSCQPIQFLMNAFQYTDNVYHYLYVEDGTVTAAYLHDEWKEGLTYINKLVSEDLLSPLSFTQDAAQLTAMVKNEDVQIVGVYTSGASLHTSGAAKDAFAPLAPLTGPDGACYSAYKKAKPSGKFVITSDCEDVDAAIRVLDACYDRLISQVTRFGEPEVDWTTEVGDCESPYAAVGVANKTGFIELNEIWGTAQNKHWNTNNPMYRSADDEWHIHSRGVDMKSTDPSSDLIVIPQAVALYMDKHPDELLLKLAHAPEDETEFADLYAAIKTYVNESTTRFMVGEMPLSEWDEFLKTLDEIGIERMLELAQKAYINSGLN